MEVVVAGGDAIEHAELPHNNRSIHRWHRGRAGGRSPFAGPVKVHVEVGWGQRDRKVDWAVDLQVRAGGSCRRSPDSADATWSRPRRARPATNAEPSAPRRGSG